MYFKIKLNRNTLILGKEKRIIETYFTEAQHFAEAGMKVINKLGKDIEIEDVFQDDGTIKTVKYALPVFAKSSEEVHEIMKAYIAQGLENMRTTTISETKWIWI